MPQGTLLQENHIVARRYIASFNMVNSFHVSKLLCRKIVHIVSISVHIYTCFGHGLSSFKLRHLQDSYIHVTKFQMFH